MEVALSVLVVQHVACETLGAIEPALIQQGLGTRTIRVYENEPVPTTLGDARGLIVMGGPMSVYDSARLTHLKHEMQLIESALSARRPILGVCLGSQLLAHVLGSKVYAGRRKEIGWHRIQLSEQGRRDPLFASAPAEFTAFHWHGDVFDLPRDSEHLASSDLTACQAFRYDDSAYGILFHMEITELLIDLMATSFPDELAQAGNSLNELRRSAAEHLPLLSSIGDCFFGGWAKLAVQAL